MCCLSSFYSDTTMGLCKEDLLIGCPKITERMAVLVFLWNALPFLRTGEAGQLLGELPKLVTGLPIVGLALGSRLAQAIEVASADLVQLRCRDQMRGGLHALLDGADTAAPGGQYHFGRHIRRRMQAVGRDTGPREFLGQIKRHHHERQLALAIGLDAIVVVLQHDVTKVDGSLSGRTHVDNAGRSRLAQRW